VSYPALPDRRLAYDNDGTVAYQGSEVVGPGSSAVSGTVLAAWQSTALVSAGGGGSAGVILCTWFFFPEVRAVTGIYALAATDTIAAVRGSTDSTNGLDGTWETATLTGGVPTLVNYFNWRAAVKPVSFTGGKSAIRMPINLDNSRPMVIIHLYGEKAAGQTPDDILFLDPTASDAEFTAPMDFGDVPLGSTTVKTFKVQNASATKTANTINIQCNDSDFAISTDGVTYVTTINIASLASGAKSSVMYLRNTTPSPGARLGPRFARTVVTVGSWT